MDFELSLDTPPWDWPRNTGMIFQRILRDTRAKESDRLIAAKLAGDLTVMNDNLADALLAIVGGAGEPEQLLN